MKGIYWRPRTVSQTAIGIIALVSVAGIVAVETLKTNVIQPHHKEKLAAAGLAKQCMDVVRSERVRRGHPIDRELDPAGTGLIGAEMTPITTITGYLNSKRSSVNPNFAAVVVDLLREAGVREGDRVAVGYSGSFPAVNIAVLAACETLRLRPVIISSAASSQYGANLPDFLWVDMERLLFDKGLISFRSQAASIGGREDRGAAMSDDARKMVREAIAKNDLNLIEADSFTKSIDQRMNIYSHVAGETPIRTYINVGGGAVSTGRSFGKKLYRSGLNVKTSPVAAQVDCLITRFMSEGIPVIHLIRFKGLAKRYGLPVAPTVTPSVGKGGVFVRCCYNRWLAGCVLLVVLASLRMVVLTDVKSLIFNRAVGRHTNVIRSASVSRPELVATPIRPKVWQEDESRRSELMV